MSFDARAMALGGVGYAPPSFAFEGWWPAQAPDTFMTTGVRFRAPADLWRNRRRRDEETLAAVLGH